MIRGDFDGDGNEETLLFLEDSRGPNSNLYSSLHSSNPNIHDFPFNSQNADQARGLAFFKNEGDLNGDGGDEFSYATNNEGHNENRITIHLVTYDKGRWKTIHWFDVPTSLLTLGHGFIRKIAPGAADITGLNSLEQVVVRRVVFPNPSAYPPMKPQIFVGAYSGFGSGRPTLGGDIIFQDETYGFGVLAGTKFAPRREVVGGLVWGTSAVAAQHVGIVPASRIKLTGNWHKTRWSSIHSSVELGYVMFLYLDVGYVLEDPKLVMEIGLALRVPLIPGKH